MTPSTWVQGGRRRWVVSNEIAYQDSLIENAPKLDVYVSARPVHTFYENEPKHTRLWFDVDADGNLKLGRMRAQRVREFCREVLGVTPYQQFSANRGFHLHVDHPPVYAQADQYREGVKLLLQDYGLDASTEVDLQVVGNTRAMPRPPFTFNGKSVGTYGEMLFTVPVDVTENVTEILEASRNVRLREVAIPLAGEKARSALQAAASKTPAAQPRRELTSEGAKRLCVEAIRFCRDAAPFLQDGKKRVLRHLLVPAVLHLADDSNHARALCRQFVEKTGTDWSAYRTYVDAQMKAALLPDGRILFPMRVHRFLQKYPEIASGFTFLDTGETKR